MSELKIIEGDATKPQAEGNKLLIHCCNDKGAWGAGFVLALSKRWPQPEQRYRQLPAYNLGDIQAVSVERDIGVVNMIAQHNTGKDDLGRPPIRYFALDICLQRVCKLAQEHDASVHLPYLMGCALAGGEWRYVEEMLRYRLVEQEINVTAYQFKP
jgi:O-acetyl-ADP-ribose deacetylase (regulator of RNase III)